MNTNARIDSRVVSRSIVGGPNRGTLFDACQYAYSRSGKIEVYFGIVAFLPMPNQPNRAVSVPVKDMRIVRIEHEDGSGESFNLSGYCQADLSTSANTEAFESYRFEAYYSTRTRKGIIDFYKQ